MLGIDFERFPHGLIHNSLSYSSSGETGRFATHQVTSDDINNQLLHAHLFFDNGGVNFYIKACQLMTNCLRSWGVCCLHLEGLCSFKTFWTTSTSVTTYQPIWRHFPELDANSLCPSSHFHLVDRGGTVIKVLCYKSEGPWFDSRWCHCNFSLTLSFRSHCGLGVESASHRNEYQENFLGVNSADA